MVRSFFEGVGGQGRIDYTTVELVQDHERLQEIKVNKIKLLNRGQEQYAILQTLVSYESRHAQTRFYTELAVLKKLNHENIIELIGFRANPDQGIFTIVTEFFAGGTIRQFLKSHIGDLSNDLFFSWSIQATDAIHFLQQNETIHQDIRSNNFNIKDNLPTSQGLIKLSGFGYSKQTVNIKSSIGSEKDEDDTYIGHQAPEVLSKNIVSKESDIFSLTTFYWELLSKQIPFEGQDSLKIIDQLNRGDRPSVPTKCPKDLCKLLEKGWESDPDKRPTISYIRQSLIKMKNQGMDVTGADVTYGWMNKLVIIVTAAAVLIAMIAVYLS